MPVKLRKSISTRKRKPLCTRKEVPKQVVTSKKTKPRAGDIVNVVAVIKPPLRNVNIRRRKPAKDKLIYTDYKGNLVVRTPPECSKWLHEFRLRIIKHYVPPRTLKLKSEFERTFIVDGQQDIVYAVMGKSVKVTQPFEDIDNSNHVVVLRTEIIDVQASRAMFLYHEDPTMRALMAYSFLSGVTIAGMPKFDVYDITT